MRNIGRFLKRHWKAVVIVIVAIALLVAGKSLIKHFTASDTTGVTANSGGTTGTVAIDGQAVSIFDSKDEAVANPITLDAGIKSMSITGSNAKVSTDIGSVSHTSGSDYELNLNGLADGTAVTLTVQTGGDGSFFGQRLGNEVETHYLVVNVSNPEGSAPADGTANHVSGVPTGSVRFGDSSFKTYGSEAEAQAAIADQQSQFTIPTSMAKNLVLTAEPSEGTARIWASVCMVDGADETGLESRMNQDSNWTATFDLSKYAGHQVTIVLKAEDGMALSNGYSYVSFFVPSFEAEEEYIEPIVVNP